MGLRTFAGAGTFDQDDAEVWSAINRGCRGAMGVRYPVDFRGTRYYRDKPMTDFHGPGTAYPSTYSEMSEFALLIHWQRAMQGKAAP